MHAAVATFAAIDEEWSQGDHLADYTGPGKWYHIDGTRTVRDVARSGSWAADASGSTDTNFRVNNFAALTDEMVGWTLQPNVNAQIFLPIIAVDDSANTVSVAGDYESLVPSGNNAPHFRLPRASPVD